MILRLFLLFLLLFPVFSFAQETDCTSHYHDTPIGNLLARADVFANLWKKKGSVAYESEAAFVKAQEKVENGLTTPSSSVCPSGCKLRSPAYMYFFSEPNQVRSRYSDKFRCNTLSEQTEKNPYEYQLEEVNRLSDLNDWISNLSRGKSSDGKDLYRKCTGSCSPNYKYFISKHDLDDEYYFVNAKVTCGHARDKKDNQYRLQYGFRWYCEEA